MTRVAKVMGIRGLTTYVEENQKYLLYEARISDQTFVIDGNSLYYFLYEENKLDIRHGGDYKKFKDLIRLFFDNLQKCSIQSFVLFDGAFDLNKRATQLHRLQNYVEYLPAVMSQKDRKLVIPLLAGEVFQQSLEELDIPFVYTLQDADRDVARIGNQLNAFVVSNDSDFYVFPLVRGYIPLKHLIWNEVDRRGIVCNMRGKVYKASRFVELCKFEPKNFAFLAVLMGCDWVRAEVFFEFTNTLMQYTRNGGRWEKRQSRIESVMTWLSCHESDDSVLEELGNYLKSDGALSTVKWCLDFYRNLPASLESQSVLKEKLRSAISHATSTQSKVALERCYERLKVMSSAEDRLVGLARSTENVAALKCKHRPNVSNMVRNVSDNPWWIQHEALLQHCSDILQACGIFPNAMLNLDRGNTVVLLPVAVGQPCQNSPHRCSYDVRSSAYRLMRVERADEYDRRGLEYVKIGPPKTIPRCACRAGYEMMTPPDRFTSGTPTQLKSSRKYLLETLLGCDVTKERRHERFEQFALSNRDLELSLAVFVSWILKTKPPPPIACAVALAICDIHFEHEDRILSEFVGKSRDVMDSSLVNYISQWQSCLKYSLTLNRMLSSPLQEPIIGYNCTTIAKVVCALSKLRGGVVLKVSDKLRSTPTLRRRFQELSTAIHRCTDETTFQSFDDVEAGLEALELKSPRRRNRHKPKSVKAVRKRDNHRFRITAIVFLLVLSAVMVQYYFLNENVH